MSDAMKEFLRLCDEVMRAPPVPRTPQEKAAAEARRKAEQRRRVEECRPRVVADKGQIVGSAVVTLSPSDPNWRQQGDVVVVNKQSMWRADREELLQDWPEGYPRVVDVWPAREGSGT